MLLGQALLESGGEDSRDLLQKALAQFTPCRANSWITNARLLLAQAELAAGNESAAADHLAEALRLAREFSCTRLVQAQAARFA